MKIPALKELMVLRVVQDHPSHGYALAEVLGESIGWTLGVTRSALCIDEIEPAPRSECLERLVGSRRQLLQTLEDFPEHEGAAGAALTLLCAQLRLEIGTLEALLDES